MPKRKTSKLVAHHFLPTLTKPSSVVGEFISIQGREWQGCSASDKDKWFRCIVRQFESMHDFGAFKSAAFEVQEMGETGEGSLEPGVASGDCFWVGYQQPFLKYYYKANPHKLPDGHLDKPESAQSETAGTPTMVNADAPVTTASKNVGSGMPEVKQDAAVYRMYHLESDELCGKPGANFGRRQQIWTCAIRCPDEPCCIKRTLTFEKPSKVPPCSNLTGHIRDEAKKCSYHAKALAELAESSKNQVLMPGGSYETVFSFDEAFAHHVNYVMMVATGEVTGNTGQKPMFRNYVRGGCAIGLKVETLKGMLTGYVCCAGYEERATFPHYETQHRIAECIKELQVEEQMARRTALRKVSLEACHTGVGRLTCGLIRIRKYRMRVLRKPMCRSRLLPGCKSSSQMRCISLCFAVGCWHSSNSPTRSTQPPTFAIGSVLLPQRKE